jgi:hypothetical protein
MKTIWKYQLKPISNPQILPMPEGALFLAVQAQYGVATMWFQVDPNKKHEERCFRLVGTGHEIPSSCKVYLGTIQYQYGNTVVHLYEEDQAESATSIVVDLNLILHPVASA